MALFEITNAMKRLLRGLSLLVAFAAMMFACGSAAALTSRSVKLTLGTNPVRSYVLYKPANLKPGAALMIALHPGAGTGTEMEALTQFDAVADAHGFLVAYPDSLKPGVFGTDTGWEMGCCDAYSRSTTDFQFISSLIDHLVRTQHIDRRRVYLAGYSIGAAMAYRFACQLSSKIAGIASVGGYEYLSKPCQPKQPVSIYEIHGTADYFNGSCAGASENHGQCGLGNDGYEPSVMQTNLQWRQIDGCSSAVQTKISGAVSRQTWKHCSASSAVQLDTITNGRHCWPTLGSTFCAGYNASADIWQFLSHARLNPPAKKA